MKLKNRVIISGFAFFLIFGAKFGVFGNSQAKIVESNSLEIFINKLATASEAKREFGALILGEYIVNDVNEIDNLKAYLDVLITSDQVAELSSYGYSVNDVKNELDKLKNWSKSDRQSLVNYVSAGSTTALKSLIVQNDTGNNVVIGDGNTGVITEDKTDETKEEVLIEVNFTDIDNHWAKENILYMAKRGFIQGKGDNKFDPQNDITRGEFAALLVRVLDLNYNETYKIPFKDVLESKWYYEPIVTAYNNKIINGKSNDKFDPTDNITRQEIAAMIVNALKIKNMEPSLSKLMIETTLFVYKDKDKISNWAEESSAKVVKLGLISGKRFDTFAPIDKATRAESAAILLRFYKLLNK